MSRYVGRRLLQSVGLAFVVATLIAVLIRIVPGDPASVLLGEGNATPERVQALREHLGLDRPIHEQYSRWLSRAIQGDLGSSLVSKRPIVPDLARRLPRTLELTLVATLLALLIGVPLGILAAIHRNRMTDFTVSSLALLGLSSPVFVLGTLLVLVFSLHLHWIPATGFVDFWVNPAEHLRRLILPSVTLAVAMAGLTTRMARSTMLEVLMEDYVRTARAKGLSETLLLARHALPNALIPVIAIVSVQMGSLLGGSVIVEFIFNWPGLSTYLLQGIAQRDYPVVQAVVLVVSMLFIFLNLVTDLLYGLLDPRIRRG